MAGNLTLSLRTAQSALLTNQTVLDSIANNISNVNTEGYSRKIANLEQRVVNGSGAGVQMSSITRNVDEGILKTLRQETSILNTYSAQESYFLRLQNSFGAPGDNTSISHVMNEFVSSMEQLALSPEKILEQSELVRRGVEMANQLQNMSQTVQDLRLQADREIDGIITEINDLTASISQINDNIVRTEVVSQDTTDLRDQRDIALTRLSELIDVRYFIRSDGDMVVFSANGQTLVDSSANELVFNPASFVSSASTKAEGDLSGIYAGSVTDSNDFSDSLTDGQLKGLLDLRDVTLPDMQAQIDELASSLKDVFNQLHNAGVAMPGLASMTGTREFIPTTDLANTASQTITLDPTNSTADVAIVLFDSSGNQTANTTLDTIMTSGLYGSGTQTSFGAWSVSEVAATVEDWLQAEGLTSATAAIDAQGHFAIELNDLNTSLAFRDQTATADGSTAGDTSIGFDADGDGAVDETVSGFSNFFGLNDFFVDSQQRNVHESTTLSSGFQASATTLRFVDGTSTLPLDPGGAGDVTITVAAGDSFQDIADNINTNVANVVASVVPDGDGFRLRISHATGEDLAVTESGAGTLLSDIGMHVSDMATSETLEVRSDIQTSPSKVSRGQVQWDATLGSAGQYYISAGDSTVIKSMAETFLQSNAFASSGGITDTTISFSDYATTILAKNSSASAALDVQISYKTTLTQTLNAKSESVKGVNLDEEMSNLIIFEQAYTAAARVMSVIQSMLDALQNIIR